MNQDINKLTNGLLEKFSPEKIILFGSQARNEVTDDSDIDICVIADIEDEKVPILRRAIRGYIHKADGLNYLEKPVDLVLYTPRQFQQVSRKAGTLASIIAKEGVILYGR